MSYDNIPTSELEIFKSLPDIGVVIDVGARDDVDYIRLKPDIELHAFEPNPEFFATLKGLIGDRPNTYLNNYGLGDIEGEFQYNEATQSFSGGEAEDLKKGKALPVKTLDWYVGKMGIERIDFLKIDAEGYDFKVLCGGHHAVKMCRFIQYEHWNNRLQFHDILEQDFYMTYIGGRNVLCSRKPGH